MPSPKNLMTFIFTIFLCDIFIATQHFYIPQRIRAFTAFLFVALAFAGYFYLIRPKSLREHAKWVSLMCGCICLALIFVQDILARKMFTPKFLLIAVIAAVAPLAGAGIYHCLSRGPLRGNK